MVTPPDELLRIICGCVFITALGDIAVAEVLLLGELLICVGGKRATAAVDAVGLSFDVCRNDSSFVGRTQEKNDDIQLRSVQLLR